MAKFSTQNINIKKLLGMYKKSAQKADIKRISNIPRANKDRQTKNIAKNNAKVWDTQTN